MTSNELDAEAVLDRPIDPVGRPAEYQNIMIGLIGDRDPVQVQSELADQLEGVISEAGPYLRIRPKPGEWSVVEVVGHIVDAELVAAGRYRWTLAHEEPTLVGFDQDRWVERLRHQESDAAELLALFRALRKSNLDLWSRAGPQDRDRVGIHSERGPESFDLLFKMVAAHGLFHLTQIRRTLQTLAAGSST